MIHPRNITLEPQTEAEQGNLCSFPLHHVIVPLPLEANSHPKVFSLPSSLSDTMQNSHGLTHYYFPELVAVQQVY